MWGPNTLPHISSLTSLPSSFLTSSLPPPHSNTLSYTSSHTSSHISPSSPHSPTHFPTPIPTTPSPSQRVAKLPCDKVSVAKLLPTAYLSCLGTKYSKTLIPVLVLRFISCLSGSSIPYCCSNIIYTLQHLQL